MLLVLPFFNAFIGSTLTVYSRSSIPTFNLSSILPLIELAVVCASEQLPSQNLTI